MDTYLKLLLQAFDWLDVLLLAGIFVGVDQVLGRQRMFLCGREETD